MAVACEYRGRDAWRLRGQTHTVVVTKTGGHVASITLNDDEKSLNPLWDPHWPSASPAAAASGAYGEGPEAALLASICGSSLCVDRFGAPHPGEQRPLHGEAGVVDFFLDEGSGDAGDSACIAVAALLPAAQLLVRRKVSLVSGGLSIATSVRQVGDGAELPRYAEWCEHCTAGGAFLDGATVAASVDTCTQLPATDKDDEPLVEVDLASALAIPDIDAGPEGHVRTCRVVDGAESAASTWAISNARLGFRLSAEFRRDDFPWICIWTESRLRTHLPWDGVERTRGMEMSTKPFPEGKPPTSRATTFKDRPACFFIPGSGQVASKSITLRWERI
jgi:hypothetical protein